MKKILCAAAALSLIGSAAFADITISGRGFVETNVFQYKKDGGTTLFSKLDTGDTDVFISGDIEGKAGAMINLDGAAIGNLALNTNVDHGTTVGLIGDWNVWIKPLDFLTIKASNEANRVANRYNSIIDKTESKWGTLSIGTKDEFNYKDANDDDSFKGYQVNLDFNVVKIDLGFNREIQANEFSPQNALFFKDNENRFGAGARVIVPIEGLLNVDAFFKMDQAKDSKDFNNNPIADYTKMTFGAIVDILAIDNMGLAIGYIGHSDKVADDDMVLTNAVDVRFQYNMDKMGFALHNNATFGEKKFANKTNLGFMYGLTDAATLFVEVQNYLANLEGAKANGDDWLADVVTVYPRFAFGIAEGVTLKTGLRADFGVTEDFDALEIALPLSMEVIF